MIFTEPLDIDEVTRYVYPCHTDKTMDEDLQKNMELIIRIIYQVYVLASLGATSLYRQNTNRQFAKVNLLHIPWDTARADRSINAKTHDRIHRIRILFF